MSNKQKTIKKEIEFSGIGLHTGCQVDMKLKPSPENSGITFVRIDLPQAPVLRAEPSNVFPESKISRCTSIGKGDAVIHTVEHLMSALCGLGIDNVIVEVNEKEIPGLDGSSIEFLKAIEEAGVVEQNEESQFFKIQEPVGVELNGSSIYIVPSDELQVSYTLDYNHPVLRSQFFSLTIDQASYKQEIAPCRTFVLEREAQKLKARGLGKGANYTNTLVVTEDGVKENQVRFPDEFARHKVLDLIGDLYLLGMPIRGHIFAIKSGHRLNLQLLKKIAQQKEKYQKKSVVVDFDTGGQKEIDISGIMKILPHRYPFLLVDRVIELESGKKAIGIKNVTINDNFFQGHFPSRPIMPGVLLVEAMAQTAGVVVLTNDVHHGKLAFFMAADNVKFRKVVVPGDQLVMEVEVVRDRIRTAQIHAKAKVDGEIVAEADMIFSFTDVSYLEE